MDILKSKAVKLQIESDELLQDAITLVCKSKKVSASLIQRRLGIGYARAARILDQLESIGAVSSADGSNPREVLISTPEDLNMKENDESDEVEISSYEFTLPKTNVIEKPKNNPWKKSFYDVVQDNSFNNAPSLSIPIGFNKEDKLIIESLNEIKHLVIGGSNLSQKEVMIDTILTSLLVKESPIDLKLILVDQVMYLNYYDNLPHLLTPVINSPEKYISASRWLISEIDRRLKLFVDSEVRDLNSYNEKADNQEAHILVVINQIEDLMMFSSNEIKDSLARILLMSHRAGIHLIVSANHLTNKFIPSSILSEIPNKLLFKFNSYHDAGTKTLKEVENLKPGEEIYVSNNNVIKLDAIYTSEDNIKKLLN